MALPASGQISLDDINVELGNSTGSQASMDTMTAAAVGDSNITNEPDNTADWYSYAHETIPTAPTGAATTYNSKFCTMTTVWNDNSDNEDGFRIERNANSAGFVFLINKPAGATNHVEVVNASKSTNTYQYRVRAYNGAGDSAWSTGTQKTTSPTCIPT